MTYPDKLKRRTLMSKPDFDTDQALNAFSALSQQTRLEVFRLLISAGADGIAAGDISEQLDVRQNTLSTNLNILVNADLITRSRQGRSIRYFANFNGLRGLLKFLMEDCCGGQPEQCEPIITEIACAAC
ncbi:MAG: ArsR/SmtB family transcription factor [Burkholderiaceae bacterium]